MREEREKEGKTGFFWWRWKKKKRESAKYRGGGEGERSDVEKDFHVIGDEWGTRHVGAPCLRFAGNRRGG